MGYFPGRINQGKNILITNGWFHVRFHVSGLGVAADWRYGQFDRIKENHGLGEEDCRPR